MLLLLLLFVLYLMYTVPCVYVGVCYPLNEGPSLVDPCARGARSHRVVYRSALRIICCFVFYVVSRHVTSTRHMSH